MVVVHGNAPGVSWVSREEGYQRFARFMHDMARRYPHARQPPENDAVHFDQEQQRQWQACLASNRELGLYAKLLPYQFAAGNEPDDDHQIGQQSQLPPNLTIDDFGFGIVRRDGRTPRPTYQWLLQEQVNGAIQEEPTYEVDISCRPAKDRVPVGYDYFWQGEELVIRRVKIDGAYPTRIELKEEVATDR